MDVFNPYAGMAPPDCCYCAPLANPMGPDIEIVIDTPLSGGIGQLAMMTRSEDAFRVIAQARVDGPASVVEMGHGPFSFTREAPRS